MDPWFSGAVIDAVREAKSRRAVFIVYLYDDSETSQYTDQLWTDIWENLNDASKIVALRLHKDAEASRQFQAIYKVNTYPTIYFINAQDGRVLTMLDQRVENSSKLLEMIQDSLNTNVPKQDTTTAAVEPTVTRTEIAAQSPPPTTPASPVQPTKTVEQKVAEARERLKILQDKREEEANEKEKQDEIQRRSLGQQMLLDKQKKEEELIRKHAEDLRRDKVEQQKLQEKLKAQIQQDREEKRRKYEQEQVSITQKSQPLKVTTAQVETPKINYTRSRLQFRLTDGSFFTEDFACDAKMTDVYAYLHQVLPSEQYGHRSYVLRTTHTRTTLTRDNPNTLRELELVPSAVLLVIHQGNATSSLTASSTNGIFQSMQFIFAWLFMQLNFFYQLIWTKLFGNRTATPPSGSTRDSARPTVNKDNSNRPKTKENFKTDSTEKPTFRRFHNTQDDSDDDEKRTWNGNSTQQM